MTARSTLPRATALVLSIHAACAPTVSQQSALMQESGAIQTSAREVHVRVAGLGRHAAAIVERQMDSIRVVVSSPVGRRNALLLKARGIRAIQDASLYPEPLVAYMDLAALTLQARYWLDSQGEVLLGNGAPLARTAFSHIEQDVRDLGARLAVAGRVDSFFARLDAWARANPIYGPGFVREGIADEVATIFPETGDNLGDFLGNFENVVYRMEERVTFLQEFAVKDALWQMELAAPESDLFRPLNRASEALERVLPIADSLPALIRGERMAALEAVSAERLALLLEVDRQRRVSLVHMDSLLTNVFLTVNSERDLLLDAFRAERALVLAQADSLSRGLLAESRGIVDHLFYRLAQFTAILLALLGLGALGVWWLAGRRRTPGGVRQAA